MSNMKEFTVSLPIFVNAENKDDAFIIVRDKIESAGMEWDDGYFNLGEQVVEQ